MRFFRILVCFVGIGCAVAAAQEATPIQVGTALEGGLAPGASRSFLLNLQSGDTALVIVRQIDIDLVVDVNDPAGMLVDSVDSPNGRNGDEVVEIHALNAGSYKLRLRPYDDKEPAGRYALRYVSRHDRAQSLQIEQQAEQWLASRSVAIPAKGKVPEVSGLSPLEQVARDVRVLGIGEATHGSRELGDLRLSLTKRLIAHNGFRIVAIEASESRYVTLEPYLRGKVQSNPEVSNRIEAAWRWIGRRAQGELVEWVRGWNVRHPRDQVRIVGIDAQDNRDAREILGPLLQMAYGDATAKRWKEAEAELIAADEQTFVFADSGISAPTKQFLIEVNAMLDVDAGILETRMHGAEFQRAREAARTLLEFADFNSNGQGSVISHTRDWYMANRLLRVLNEEGARARAIYWAHNAHVVHPKGSSRTAGALLRDLLGCGYAALGLTFGEGGFVAQMPNDLEDRLVASSVPLAPRGTLEAVLARNDSAGSLTAWGCAGKLASMPEWFSIPRKMHWVGGLYKPGTNPAEAFRPFDLLNDFDGVVYLPKVTADEIPQDRPLIPARKR